MSEFTINTGQGYSLQFHSKENRNGLEYYSVTLKAPNAHATIRVYDHPNADSIVGFFLQLANNWRRLQRGLIWRSMEGEFSLSATSDSTGHTYLVAIAYTHADHEPPLSELKVGYVIEAGQLAKIHKDVKKFFK